MLPDGCHQRKEDWTFFSISSLLGPKIHEQKYVLFNNSRCFCFLWTIKEGKWQALGKEPSYIEMQEQQLTLSKTQHTLSM